MCFFVDVGLMPVLSIWPMNTLKYWVGLAFALASSFFFGLIPLFAIPLINSGLPPQIVALYRFGFAALLICPLLCCMRVKIILPWRDLLVLALLALAYFLDVQLFFYAFQFLASGIVATLEFLAPVMVMAIMILVFHQRFRYLSALACALAIIGIWFLSGGDAEGVQRDGTMAVYAGTSLALLSALCCALYMVGCEVSGIERLHPLLVTFYIMLFGSLYCATVSLWTDAFVMPDTWVNLGRALLLALLTAFFSNLFLVMAIQRIGSVLTSILGVLEPLTAVCIGVWVFNEKLTPLMLLGAILVIGATLLASLSRK